MRRSCPWPNQPHSDNWCSFSCPSFAWRGHFSKAISPYCTSPITHIARCPNVYKIAAVWGAHEGSLLLWILLLAGWTVAVTRYSADLPRAMTARVVGVLGLLSCGIPHVHIAHLESFRAANSCRNERIRFESAVAGPGSRHSSTDSVRGLRWLFGCLRIRHRGNADRATSTRPGPAGRGRGRSWPGCS